MIMLDGWNVACLTVGTVVKKMALDQRSRAQLFAMQNNLSLVTAPFDTSVVHNVKGTCRHCA